MTVKEAFEKAENGTLTYEQFQELTKDAKFADLATGEYVSKRKFDDELAGKNKQIDDLNASITTRDTDLASLKKQLEEAGVDKDALARLTTDMAALQNKYDTDMKANQDKLEAQRYEFAVRDFASTKKFSSKAAKKDFVNSMIGKKLQMENDTILGAEDFAAAYAKDDPSAFVVEKKEEEPPKAEDKPRFVQSTGDGGKAPESNLFGFHFQGVR